MEEDKTLKENTAKGRPPQTASYRRRKQSERVKKANKAEDDQASVNEKSSNMAQEDIVKCSKDKAQESATAMQQIGTVSIEIAQQVSEFIGKQVAQVAEVPIVANVNTDLPVIENVNTELHVIAQVGQEPPADLPDLPVIAQVGQEPPADLPDLPVIAQVGQEPPADLPVIAQVGQEPPVIENINTDLPNEIQAPEVQVTTEVEVPSKVVDEAPAPCGVSVNAEVESLAEVVDEIPTPCGVEVNIGLQASAKEVDEVAAPSGVDVNAEDTIEEHARGNNNGDDEENGSEQSDDDEEEDEDDEGEEEGEDDSDEEDEIREEVKLDFTKSKLYRSFKCHVASLLLRRKNIQDRGVLGCKQRTKKLMEWDLAKEHESVMKLVEGSPLYCLAKCLYKSCDKVLISGFVERWHAETNTFHSSFGEITVTLDDVQKIIGLPIMGHGVTGVETSSIPGETIEVFLRRMFGISLKKIKEEFQGSTWNNIKLEFLRLNLAGNSLERCTAEQVARGYLLYLLGCTLFQDKTGDKVSLKYLYYLENLNEIGKWSWGAAGLAHLYRELGKASRHGTKTISGYLTLLQAWVYEHFPTLRPHKSIEMTKGMTRTEQWTPRSHYNARDANSLLKSLRIHLDSLTKTDVVWTPYRKVDESPDEVAWYTGVLMVDDIIEPYQPDRVVRQFGHVQDTPRDPLAPKRVRKSGSKAMSYTPRFDGRTDEFERWSDHVLNLSNRGPRMKTKGECTVSYANWVKENLICRLDFSMKDPLAPEMEDETKFAAWKVLDSVSSKSIKQELLVAIDKAKALLKPELPDSEARQDAGTSKTNTSGAKKHKRN